MKKDEISEKANKENCEDKDKKKKSNRILNIIMIFAICIIVYGIWSVIALKMQYKKAGEEYEKLRKAMDISSEENLLNKDAPNVNIDLERLKKENPDTVGWIYYPCLNINYPIMKDEDNTYYIKHTFSGDKNDIGSIFLDCIASEDFTDDNTFLYGHNAMDGSMLGSLKNIREEGVVEKNPYFWIYTENGWQKYSIFSYHDAKKTDDTFKIKFDNEEEHKAFLEHIVELSEEKIDVKVSEKDKIVTLATCTSDSSIRFVVHGVKIK